MGKEKQTDEPEKSVGFSLPCPSSGHTMATPGLRKGRGKRWRFQQSADILNVSLRGNSGLPDAAVVGFGCSMLRDFGVFGAQPDPSTCIHRCTLCLHPEFGGSSKPSRVNPCRAR